MSKFNYFVGIDVSKDVFDAVFNHDHVFIHEQFENTRKGVKSLCRWLKKLTKNIEECLVCCEHTGMYVNHLTVELSKQNIALWLEMSYRIIKSSGLQRGKTDKVDAKRIAEYAKRFHSSAELFKPCSEELNKLQVLIRHRSKIIKHRTAYIKTIKELERFDPNAAKLTKMHSKSILKALSLDLKKTEASIQQIINRNEEFAKNKQIITSIPGVGELTAACFIAATKNFTSFNSAKQLACYCGVVPFEHTSGKSIKGKPRVHFMANKRLKHLLHMCALSSTIHNPELRAYFQRKVTEGKSKALVINNIRNKIVLRIVACINAQRPYEPVF